MSDIICKFAPAEGVPLPEYPRPQFERDEWLNLNGEYDYAITKSADRPEAFDGKILVPFAIESRLSGVERHLEADETLWYRRNFTIPENWMGKRILLHFGAVDYLCEVFINGNSVGKHRGGYSPFSFDITDFLQKENNELSLSVTDPTDLGGQQRGKQASATHGFWYTATSGIWQTVWLEPVCEAHLEKIKMTPDLDASLLHTETAIPTGTTLLAKVLDADGKIVAEKTLNEKDEIALPLVHPWSPEDPYLYSIHFSLMKEKSEVDAVRSYFGMRKFSLQTDDAGYRRLCLNNQPYFQTGLLDQGYWCDSGLTPPSEEAMVYDIQKMKDLGFNMLRKHIKVEPLRWYYQCDKLGMLVWQDMVSGGDYVSTLYVGALPNLGIHLSDTKNYARFKRENLRDREEFLHDLNQMMENLHNQTSICCWVPFNEGWGQFDALKIGRNVKEKDPSRFVDHASGWHDQGGPDFVSRHRYILPVTLPKKDINRPFVLSEFGGYSQIIDGHVWNKSKSFGYMMFKSKEALTKAVKKLYEKQIIPLVKKGLSACIYTQVSDVEYEVNGILTYDREIVKIDEETMKNINKKLRNLI